MRRILGLIPLVVVTLAGCAGPSPSAPALPGMPAGPALSVANGATVPVAVVVNGTLVETVEALTTEDPIHVTLPVLPWTVEARSPSGRVLATLTVSAADYGSSTSGKFARADLACGRLDVWSGPRVLGPAFSPDPSKPCD